MTSAMTPIGIDLNGYVLGSWTPPCRTPPLPHELYADPGSPTTTTAGADYSCVDGSRQLTATVSPALVARTVRHHTGGSVAARLQAGAGKQCSCEADHYLDGYSELYRPVPGILRYAGDSCNIMPEEQRRFLAYKVESIIKDLLEIKLKNACYDPTTCNQLAHDLCEMIKERTKDFRFERYKLVTQVLIGEDTDQSVQIASRCLWNQDTDNFAAATFRNSSMYAVAIVYGLYLE